MKKFFFGFAFIAAICSAFATNRPSATALSYKQAGEVPQQCHITNIPVNCDGTGIICTITSSGITRTYFQDNGCMTVLKKQ